MKRIKYFLQYIIILFLFIIFKILGLKYSSILSGYIAKIFGPLFRSKKIIHSNLNKALPGLKHVEKKNILKNILNNYGVILAEYMFIQKILEQTQNIKIKLRLLIKKY